MYSDNILIATKDLNEHFEILVEVFKIAGENHLNFRLDKCTFAQKELDYMGYHISGDGISPSEAHVVAIKNYPVPRNQKHILRFVCIAGYFRCFVPGFSEIAKPLYDLTRKDSKFMFGEKECEALDKLKELLTSSPVLAIYNPTADTELQCDASSTDIRAILIQKQADGRFRPVSYFSQRTTPQESRYHSFELECLVVVYAIKTFHIYLSGIDFKIITDCDNFRLTLSKQNINSRIARWAMFLQDYNFEIFHRPGKRMGHVDALSRCHSVLVVEDNTFEQTLALHQHKDEKIKIIREKLEKSEMQFYELRDGLAYRKDKLKKLFFYVAERMELNVIRIFLTISPKFIGFPKCEKK